MCKLVVLSDLHLMASCDTGRDLGNHARLSAAIDRINTAYADADLVVFAGDLVDRKDDRAAYADLKAALSDLVPPSVLTIGNHDTREVYREVFAAGHCDENGFVQSAHDLGETRVIVLDSVSDLPAPAGFRGARDPGGQLCETRLAWLDQKLTEAEGQPVIVVLHHPPLKLQITTDVMSLNDPDGLIDRLASHGQVRQVLSGHIHMTTTAFHRGIPFTTIAGGFSTSGEDFGRAENKFRREGPAQMAVVLSDTEQTTVHFDAYVDANPLVESR
ncbi:MAG: metallophosphoesterase [Pseudomonadota bacterium]